MEHSASATLILTVPAWLSELRAEAASRELATAADRMRLAIEASRRGSAAGDGGPFGAAVFEMASGRLVSLGANLVLATGCTVLHAEIVALIGMQERPRGSSSSVPGVTYELVTSAEPCAMCMGAIVWAGISRVLVGARDADVRAIGFDEGDKPADWAAAYRRRGIEVLPDVLRTEAVQVLQAFRTAGGTLY